MSIAKNQHCKSRDNQKECQSKECLLIYWSLPPPNQPPEIPLLGWNSTLCGQENLWLSAFTFFFRPFYDNYRHVWTLQRTDKTPISRYRHVWYNAVYFAKVRFDCEKCRRRWTSFKGRVVFWFGLEVQQDSIYYRVWFKILGQQCLYCVRSPEGKNDFISALWYPDEIEASVRLLNLRVIENFYLGLIFPNLSVSPSRRLDSKAEKKMDSLYFHDYNRCQACRVGDRCK